MTAITSSATAMAKNMMLSTCTIARTSYRDSFPLTGGGRGSSSSRGRGSIDPMTLLRFLRRAVTHAAPCSRLVLQRGHWDARELHNPGMAAASLPPRLL